MGRERSMTRGDLISFPSRFVINIRRKRVLHRSQWEQGCLIIGSLREQHGRMDSRIDGRIHGASREWDDEEQ